MGKRTDYDMLAAAITEAFSDAVYHVVDRETGEKVSSHKASRSGGGNTTFPLAAQKKADDLNQKHFDSLSPEERSKPMLGRYSILHNDAYEELSKIGHFKRGKLTESQNEYADHPSYLKGKAVAAKLSKKDLADLHGKVERVSKKVGHIARKTSNTVLSFIGPDGQLPSREKNKELDSALSRNASVTKLHTRLRLFTKGINDGSSSK